MPVNYDDERFQQVNAEKEVALNKVNDTYNNMINQSDNYYQNQIDAVNQWGDTQKQLQQEQTDLTVEKINQQKEWAKQDYEKEQKASYVDYKKQLQSAPETVYSQGMKNTGWSETSLRDIYNTYENRVATARDSFNRLVTNYDLAIKDAIVSNNSALAEIAFNTLQKGLELSLQGFQYKNGLLETQLQMANNTEDRYYSRWKDVLDQINTENALEEQKRQFDQQMALQWSQLNESNGIDWNDDENTDSDPVIYGLQSKFVGEYVNIYDENGNLIDRVKVYETDDGRQNQRWYFDGTTGKYKIYNGKVANKYTNIDTKNTKTTKTVTKTNPKTNVTTTVAPRTVERKTTGIKGTSLDPFPKKTF